MRSCYITKVSIIYEMLSVLILDIKNYLGECALSLCIKTEMNHFRLPGKIRHGGIFRIDIQIFRKFVIMAV